VKESSGIGLTNVQYWALTGIGIVALVLVILNISTAMTNADARKEANERQQYINQSVQLGQLNSQLVQGLANLAARSGDEELRAVLAQHGISFSVKDQASEVSSGDAVPAEQPQTTGQGGKQE
jgi:ABC-type Na+ efflux pump permease subunit